MRPPAHALAVALNRWRCPKLPADARATLSRRPVQIDVTDLGLSLILLLDDQEMVLVLKNTLDAIGPLWV